VTFQIAGGGLWQGPKTGAGFEPPKIIPAELEHSAWRTNDAQLDAGIRLIGWLYEIRRAYATLPFLRKNLILIPLLSEMYGQICLRFGPETQIALDLFTDREAKSDFELLVIVRTRFTPELALRALDEFDVEWWLNALPRANHKVTVAVEYNIV